MNAVMEIKGEKDKHYYSVLGCARGDDAAFPQSNNVFKYLCVCVLRLSTFLHILCFSTAALLPSHSCGLYEGVCVCVYSHIFLYGCLTDSTSLYGAAVSE